MKHILLNRMSEWLDLKNVFLVLLFLCSIFGGLHAQTVSEVVYKKVNAVSLKMTIYQPENMNPLKTYPTVVFFFGGGWETGNISQFTYYATHFAKKGMIAVLPDYRVSSRNNTTPIESLKDAKSAIRFLKIHADSLQIDTLRLAASGGSAGGQLAAACFTNETFNESTDLIKFNSKPKALVLFNPVVDNSPTGYGNEKLGDNWKAFSPIDNIHTSFPPTTFFLGRNDNLVPVATGQLFKHRVDSVGGRCDLHLYNGVGHGFFNLTDYRDQVISVVDTFFQSIGYLPYDERIVQTITFPLLSTKYLNDGDFEPGATASSNLAISYTSSNENVATIINGKIHIIGTGSAIITALQPGNDVYSKAANVSQVLVVSSNDTKEDYWVDLNFTRDSTIWKTAFPALAPNGLSMQCNTNGEYLGFSCIGAFGKFAVLNYIYTPFSLENLNEKFIYSFRISKTTTNYWAFPKVPNVGTIKVHYLSGSNVGNTTITLQKNIAEDGQSANWVEFDPQIKIIVPTHGFSSTSFMFEKELNINEATQLRFSSSSDYNVCIYKVIISKKKEVSKIEDNQFERIHINLVGRSLQIINNEMEFEASIYNMSGIRLGSIKKHEILNFTSAGHYIISITDTEKTIVKKILVN